MEKTSANICLQVRLQPKVKLTMAGQHSLCYHQPSASINFRRLCDPDPPYQMTLEFVPLEFWKIKCDSTVLCSQLNVGWRKKFKAYLSYKKKLAWATEWDPVSKWKARRWLGRWPLRKQVVRERQSTKRKGGKLIMASHLGWSSETISWYNKAFHLSSNPMHSSYCLCSMRKNYNCKVTHQVRIKSKV